MARRIAPVVASVTVIAACVAGSPNPPTPPSSPDAALARWRSCLDASAALAHAADGDAGVAARALIDACGAVYEEPSCREGWATAATAGPEVRATTIVEACAAAYCPKLTPQPALCRRDPSNLGHTDLLTHWTAFELAVFELEVGEEKAADFAPAHATLLGLLTAVPVDLDIDLPKAESTETPASQTFFIRSDGSGVVVESDLGDGLKSWHIESEASVESFVADIERSQPAPRAVLAVDAQVGYAALVRVMDALQRAGVDQLALSVSPPEE